MLDPTRLFYFAKFWKSSKGAWTSGQVSFDHHLFVGDNHGQRLTTSKSSVSSKSGILSLINGRRCRSPTPSGWNSRSGSLNVYEICTNVLWINFDLKSTSSDSGGYQLASLWIITFAATSKTAPTLLLVGSLVPFISNSISKSIRACGASSQQVATHWFSPSQSLPSGTLPLQVLRVSRRRS